MQQTVFFVSSSVISFSWSFRLGSSSTQSFILEWSGILPLARHEFESSSFSLYKFFVHDSFAHPKVVHLHVYGCPEGRHTESPSVPPFPSETSPLFFSAPPLLLCGGHHGVPFVPFPHLVLVQAPFVFCCSPTSFFSRAPPQTPSTTLLSSSRILSSFFSLSRSLAPFVGAVLPLSQSPESLMDTPFRSSLSQPLSVSYVRLAFPHQQRTSYLFSAPPHLSASSSRCPSRLPPVNETPSEMVVTGRSFAQVFLSPNAVFFFLHFGLTRFSPLRTRFIATRSNLR